MTWQKDRQELAKEANQDLIKLKRDWKLNALCLSIKLQDATRQKNKVQTSILV